MPKISNLHYVPHRIPEGFSTTLSSALTAGSSFEIALTDNIPGYVAFDTLDLIINDGTNVEVATIQGSGTTSPYSLDSSYDDSNQRIINSFASGTPVYVGVSAYDQYVHNGAMRPTDTGDVSTEFDPSVGAARAFYRQLDANVSNIGVSFFPNSIVINGDTYYFSMDTIIMLEQDGTGGRTVTWDSAIKWAGGTAPTMTSTAGAIDAYRVTIFNNDGTTTAIGEIIAQDVS